MIPGTQHNTSQHTTSHHSKPSSHVCDRGLDRSGVQGLAEVLLDEVLGCHCSAVTAALVVRLCAENKNRFAATAATESEKRNRKGLHTSDR